MFQPPRLAARVLLAGFAALALPTLAVADDATSAVTGTFAGEHGTPSTPTGTVDGTFDRKTDKLTYHVTYSGLTGPVQAAHFHGPATPPAEAGVMKPISPPYDSPISGTWTLTKSQAKALEAGEVYVNLHTKAYPGGEARANLTVK